MAKPLPREIEEIKTYVFQKYMKYKSLSNLQNNKSELISEIAEEFGYSPEEVRGPIREAIDNIEKEEQEKNSSLKQDSSHSLENKSSNSGTWDFM